MSYFWPILVGLLAVAMAVLAFRVGVRVARILFIVAAVCLAIGTVQLIRAQGGNSWSGGEIHDAAEQAAQALETEEGVLADAGDEDRGFFSSYVEDKLQHTDAAHANRGELSVSRDQAQGGPADPRRQKEIVERYAVSDRGRHAVCMTVTGTRAGRVMAAGKVSPDYYWKLSVEVASGSC
ncbi:hypothetical protein GCM10023191_054710 [Actinoallomurus oryzae]|uniref:Secreted protein n=1 Tax=Actinoallomurus oryzae TaxID=502180 RepID=A0ABP8QHR2_9ACTN